MGYSDEVLRRARYRYEQAKLTRENEYKEHLRLAYTRYPRLEEIDDELKLTMIDLVRSTLLHGENPAKAIEELRDVNLKLQEEREWILDASDFEEGFLDDSPICAKCNGVGYINGKMCDCFRELCRQEQRKELTSLLHSGKDSFDAFRMDVYPDSFSQVLGASPRQIMQSNFNICRRYAQNFSMDAGNLLFSGATGLGKTFLSACIARQVADSGFSVVYETAAKLFADFEKEKFHSNNDDSEDLTKKYFDCDLLIIDDLATEMTTNFVVSALYTLINARIMGHRPTIISTNLATGDLESRYNPQIASRIVGTFRLIKFVGTDIRRK